MSRISAWPTTMPSASGQRDQPSIARSAQFSWVAEASAVAHQVRFLRQPGGAQDPQNEERDRQSQCCQYGYQCDPEHVAPLCPSAALTVVGTGGERYPAGATA